MLSVIISSGNQQLLRAVQLNIAETVGIPHEIIAIDNTGAKRGICEIYNEGMQKAQYPMLCFLHEDIILQTTAWGQKVLQIFADNPTLGLLGVAGSPYKTLVPGSWNGPGPDVECINLIQAYKFTAKEPYLDCKNPQNVKLAEVAAIDGVWFCAPKAITLQHPFDAAIFKGFHGYDVDFSLSVGTAYQVAVTYEVLLTHLSEGNYSRAWLQDILSLHQKWQSRLPVNKGKLPLAQTQRMEKIAFRQFIVHLTRFNMPVADAFKWLWQSWLGKRLGINLFLKLNFYALKKMAAPKRPE